MPRYQLSLSSKATQERAMDGQRPAKSWGRSKAKIQGTERLRIGITLATSALNEAVFLFDACAGLTEAVVILKHQLSQRVGRFYSRLLVKIEEEIKIQEREGSRLTGLEVSCFRGFQRWDD